MHQGFTLIELMLVLTIFIILMMITVSATKRSWEAQEIKASALKLAHDLSIASQTAVRLNTTVEVRFYLFYDMGIASTQPQFRGYQLLRRDPITGPASAIGLKSVAVPLFELQRFEGNTIMSSRTKYSSLVGGRVIPWQRGSDPDIGVNDYGYFAIEFRPDGTTSLEPPGRTPWTISLGPLRWVDNPLETPKEIQCLGIDWATGAVRIF